MDMTVITSLITGARFAKDSLEITLGYKIENETRAKINEALKQVGTRVSKNGRLGSILLPGIWL